MQRKAWLHGTKKETERERQRENSKLDFFREFPVARRSTGGRRRGRQKLVMANLASKSGLLKRYLRPEVYPLAFMLSMALGLGGVTVYRGLVSAPDVLVSKKRRERLPEIDFPNHTASLSENYIEKSPLRNFARACDISPTKSIPSQSQSPSSLH